MTKPAYDLRPSRLLGREMLDAWLCGDCLRLSQNLREVCALPMPLVNSAERDRLETLKAIAQRMRLTADLAASRAEDPRIGSWISLLDHLAGSDSYDSERGAPAVGQHFAFETGLAVHEAIKQ